MFCFVRAEAGHWEGIVYNLLGRMVPSLGLKKKTKDLLLSPFILRKYSFFLISDLNTIILFGYNYLEALCLTISDLLE